jgi:hypothetical protein
MASGDGKVALLLASGYVFGCAFGAMEFRELRS